MINFIHDDFTKVDLSDADIIFSYSTCFDEDLMQTLAKRIAAQVKRGTRIITVTKPLAVKKIKVRKVTQLPMEWGQATVYYQEKI
jgi:hypothetical protein